MKPTTRLRRRLLVATTLLAFCGAGLNGCADFKKAFNLKSIDEDGNEIAHDFDLPAKTLLSKGMDDYNVGKYFSAIEYFDEIRNKYPFSTEAILAELKAADCSYHLERYQEAIILYEEFENRHPTNESMPYVMFQKAMCNYKQIDRVDRDTAGAEKAIKVFRQLLQAYPSSAYTNEAKMRVTECTEFLADHEYVVVEYYLRTEKYDQAQVRLRYLLAMYPDTRVAPAAQKLLSELETAPPKQKSVLTSWLPKISLPGWIGGEAGDEEDSTAGPIPR